MPGQAGTDEHQCADRKVDAAGEQHERHAHGDDDRGRRLADNLCGILAREEPLRLEPDCENEHHEQRNRSGLQHPFNEPVTAMPGIQCANPPLPTLAARP